MVKSSQKLKQISVSRVVHSNSVKSAIWLSSYSGLNFLTHLLCVVVIARLRPRLHVFNENATIVFSLRKPKAFALQILQRYLTKEGRARKFSDMDKRTLRSKIWRARKFETSWDFANYIASTHCFRIVFILLSWRPLSKSYRFSRFRVDVRWKRNESDMKTFSCRRGLKVRELRNVLGKQQTYGSISSIGVQDKTTEYVASQTTIASHNNKQPLKSRIWTIVSLQFGRLYCTARAYWIWDPYGFWKVHTDLNGSRINQSNREF